VNCENRDRTPRQRRNGADVHISIPWVPALLIAWGAAALLQNIVGHGVSVIPLTIGVLLVIKAQSADHYPLLVVGSVLAGNGAGNLIGDILGHGLDGPLGTFGAAAAFLWLRSTDPQRSRWAVVPAIVLAFIGLGQLGDKMSTLAAGWGAGWLVPAGVIVAGVLLIGAHRLPGPVRLAGFVFVIAAGLSFLSGGDKDRGHLPPAASPPPAPSTMVQQDTFEIGTREVWVTTSNGAVTVNDGDSVVRGGRAVLSEGRVTIEPTSDNNPVTLSVPQGTTLHIQTGNGMISVDVPGAELDLETENGALDVTLTGDPTIVAATDNGSLVVDDKSFADDYRYRGDGALVTLRTNNGPITISHVSEPVAAGSRAR
jgi:hypothetical protein